MVWKEISLVFCETPAGFWRGFKHPKTLSRLLCPELSSIKDYKSSLRISTTGDQVLISFQHHSDVVSLHEQTPEKPLVCSEASNFRSNNSKSLQHTNPTPTEPSGSALTVNKGHKKQNWMCVCVPPPTPLITQLLCI